MLAVMPFMPSEERNKGVREDFHLDRENTTEPPSETEFLRKQFLALCQ